MEPYARWLDWSSNPIAERMSFSSFSHSVDNIWGYDIVRPYQIVLLPGYRVPASLDREDKDALWFHKEEVNERPVVVWDGFCPTALFEIIRECFDYDGSSKFIVVRDAKTGKKVKDTRDPDVLALRPNREAGWGPRKIHNHITELMVWSTMFPSGNKTSQLYNEMLMEDSSELPTSPDAYVRACEFINRGMHDVDAYALHAELIAKEKSGEIKVNKACCFGKPMKDDDDRVLKDHDVGLLDTTFHGVEKSGRIKKEDFQDGKPDSYYRSAVRAGRGLYDAFRSGPRKLSSALKLTQETPSASKRDTSGGCGSSLKGSSSDNPF
jgi:hypothetical protein